MADVAPDEVDIYSATPGAKATSSEIGTYYDPELGDYDDYDDSEYAANICSEDGHNILIAAGYLNVQLL